MICSEFAQTSVQFTLPPTNWQSWNLPTKLEPITSTETAGHAVYLGNTCPWCHRVALALALRQVPERCIARVQCLGRQIRPQRPQKSPRNLKQKEKWSKQRSFACRDVCMTFLEERTFFCPRKSDSDSIDCAKNVCFFCMLGAIFVFTGYVGPCSLGSKPRIPKAMNHHHRTTTTTQPPAPALYFFQSLRPIGANDCLS